MISIIEFNKITGDIWGNLIEGIVKDVPSLDATVNATQALEIAVSNELDDPDDVVFSEENDGELVIYVQVRAFWMWWLGHALLFCIVDLT